MQQIDNGNFWVSIGNWEDMRIVPGEFQFSGNADPNLTTFQPGGSGFAFPVYAFQKDDYVNATCQIPHSYKEGTDLRFHIHWTARNRATAEAGATVGWKVDYSIAPIGGVFPPSQTANLTATCTGANDTHCITSSAVVSGSGLTVSSMILLKIYRSDTGSDDTWAGTSNEQLPVLLEFDIHFEQNSIGSNLETSKTYGE